MLIRNFMTTILLRDHIIICTINKRTQSHKHQIVMHSQHTKFLMWYSKLNHGQKVSKSCICACNTIFIIWLFCIWSTFNFFCNRRVLFLKSRVCYHLNLIDCFECQMSWIAMIICLTSCSNKHHLVFLAIKLHMW